MMVVLLEVLLVAVGGTGRYKELSMKQKEQNRIRLHRASEQGGPERG